MTKEFLRQLLEENLKTIDLSIRQLEKEAKNLGIETHEVVNDNGEFLLTPLIIAKNEALLTLIKYY